MGLSQGISDLNKHLKNGFNSSMVKFYHMHLTTIYILFATGLTLYAFRNGGSDNIVRDKLDKLPALQYFL